MGVIKLFSSSSSDRCRGNAPVLPNPNPCNYTLVNKYIGVNKKAFAVAVKYHDCTNYEGNKILVFKGTYEALMAQKTIDPHFCDNAEVMSPVARFVPTPEGWHDAMTYVDYLEVNANGS